MNFRERIFPREEYFDQAKPGLMWDTSTPFNDRTGVLLVGAGIENVFTCSGNKLRAAMGQQLAESIGANSLNLDTNDKEVTFRQYRQAVDLGLFPKLNVRDYQLVVSASKLQRLEELEKLPDGVILVNDTIIVPAPGDTMEKAVFEGAKVANEREVERQLRLISSGRPYLVTNSVIIFGTGKHFGKMIPMSFAIPTRMKVNGEGQISSEELYKKLRDEYIKDNHSPRFPGVISHMNPILQEHMQVCLAPNLVAHTQMEYDDFFCPPKLAEHDLELSLLKKQYGDDSDGHHYMNIQDKLVELTWYDFKDLLGDVRHKIGSSCAGCAIPAYEIGLAKWAERSQIEVTHNNRSAQRNLWKVLRMIDDLTDSGVENRLLSMPMGPEKEKLLHENYALATKMIYKWYLDRWEYAHGAGSSDRDAILKAELAEARELEDLYNDLKLHRKRDLPWYKDPLAENIWKVASEYADIAIVVASSLQRMGARKWDVEQLFAGNGRFEYAEKYAGIIAIVRTAMADIGVDLAEMIIQKMVLNEIHYPLFTRKIFKDHKGIKRDALSFKYRVPGEKSGTKTRYSFAQRLRYAIGGNSSQIPDMCGSRLGELGLSLVDKTPFGSNGSKPQAIFVSGDHATIAGPDIYNHYGGLYVDGRKGALLYEGQVVNSQVLESIGIPRRQRNAILRVMSGGYIDRLRMIARTWKQLRVVEGESVR